MRTGVVILPDQRWPDARLRWQEAEARGFTTAWTYDHLSWRSMRDSTWLGAVPLLTAVAASTTTLRIGTLVATPNFRHPALFAKDVMTLDEISGGRVDLGLGAGSGSGYDAAALGEPPLDAPDRGRRFEEFVDALDLLLREPMATYRGRFFTAIESRTFPGCTQVPRVPFTIAATGPRGMAVAARHADTWVTFGPLARQPSADEWHAAVGDQMQRLDGACAAIGRDPRDLRRAALVSLDVDWAQSSVGAWHDFAARISEIGFTEVIVHWPRPHKGGLAGPAPEVFDALGSCSSGG